MTGFEHARLTRRVINFDRFDPWPVKCAWDDCDRAGTTLWEVVLCEHTPRFSCSQTDQGIGGGRHYRLVFCRERCRQYWVASTGRNAHVTAAHSRGRIYGMLPPGHRPTL